MKHFLTIALFAITLGCSNTPKTAQTTTTQQAIASPAFSADSAMAFCERQCDFGPRTMNSEAHDRCAAWIAASFSSYGLDITEQRATLKGFDGTPLLSNNIIAAYQPEKARRIMLCAHYDSRPWADNDPNPDNHDKPVMAANDGASGVAVMMELARLLSNEEKPLPIGIDFICFDAEDWGQDGDSDSWALGAQYWAANKHRKAYHPSFAILLDMVGGKDAHFYQEGYSLYYAPEVVAQVWQAAQAAGHADVFPKSPGGTITDDHVPVNTVASIPCIDIIPYYPDCEESSFGPTWHTVNDDIAHLDPATLKAVGQTLVQLLWTVR